MVGREEGIEIGMEKGREEERRAFVENLISETEFSDIKTALLANDTVDFVAKIRMDLKS